MIKTVFLIILKKEIIILLDLDILQGRNKIIKTRIILVIIAIIAIIALKTMLVYSHILRIKIVFIRILIHFKFEMEMEMEMEN